MTNTNNQINPTTKYLRAKISPGLFSSERCVIIDIGEERYSLIVDEGDVVRDKYLRVALIEVNRTDALIDLPRQTLTSGTRLVVPKIDLVELGQRTARDQP